MEKPRQELIFYTNLHKVKFNSYLHIPLKLIVTVVHTQYIL